MKNSRSKSSSLRIFSGWSERFLIQIFQRVGKQKITLINGKRKLKPKNNLTNLWGVEQNEFDDSLIFERFFFFGEIFFFKFFFLHFSQESFREFFLPKIFYG